MNGILFNHESPRRGETFVIRIVLFAPAGTPDAAAHPSREPRPRLTPERAALLALMRAYEWVTFEPPGLIEVQKLAYFLQLSGEPLNLRFAKGRYGPYADDLRKSLRAMEGHFIVGFGDGSAPATRAEAIRVLPEVYAEVDAFLAEHPDTDERVGSVVADIDGYESSYGLELLATVHWVMSQEGAASMDRARDLVREGSSRKSSLFTGPHVASAWNTIHDRGMATALT